MYFGMNADHNIATLYANTVAYPRNLQSKSYAVELGWIKVYDSSVIYKSATFLFLSTFSCYSVIVYLPKNIFLFCLISGN